MKSDRIFQISWEKGFIPGGLHASSEKNAEETALEWMRFHKVIHVEIAENIPEKTLSAAVGEP